MTTVTSHDRSGTWVEGHFRNGNWIEGHYRSGTIVNEFRRSQFGHHTGSDVSWRLRNYTSALIYPTSCWWCGQSPVFFYRSENGGCALFDKLGWPWTIHRCWGIYRDRLLGRIGTQLDDLSFDGRRYTGRRTPIKKSKGENLFQSRGFVEEFDDRGDQPKQLLLRSSRGASTISLVPIRFVPESRTEEYLILYLPTEHADNFSPYSIHQIKAQWVNRGSRWFCVICSTRILRANARPSGRPKSILKLNGVCSYCKAELSEPEPWGLDADGSEECRQCGRMRHQLSPCEFREQVKRISKSL